MKYILIIFILLYCLGCKSHLSSDFHSYGKLVFVEALKQDDGISAGSFGDIMIFDPITKEKFRITSDQYYDESTSWAPDGSKIIFASRRTGDRKYKDLSSPSRLYEVSLKDLEVKQFDIGWNERLHHIDKEIECEEFYNPICNKTGSSIFFTTCRNDTLYFLKYQIIRYNFESDSFVLSGKYFDGIPDFVISHNNLFLAVTTSNANWNTVIKIYDLQTNKKIKSISKKKWSFRACSFYEDKLYFTGKDRNLDKPPTNFYSLDLNRMDSTLLHTFTDFSIEELVMRDSTSAFFINKDSNHGNDIYLLNLNTWKAEALTTDGLQKMGLDYLPPKKDK